MFYRDRIEKIFELKSQQNKDDSEGKIEDLDSYKDQVYLEKGDLLSMILGAYYTFLPIFIVLFIILYLTRPWQ
ncbi:MAG: hypothetical protein GX079_07950 [Tissierellia bacterium]|nr:hypothetical protein [Tissierellia bacterium]